MSSAAITETSTETLRPVESGARLRGLTLFSVVGALMLTLFLEALDQAVVGAAMPRIIAQLHGLDRYSWVVTAYILASMTMIPIVGKLSDQFGRKWFLLAGTSLFLLGSMLAGASQSMNQLIFFRAAQGLGAGIGMALVATVFGDLFPPEERAKWMSLFGMVYGVSSLFGPSLGGWLTEHGPLLGSLVTQQSRWRWVFYVNLPIGLVAVVALVILLPSNLTASAGGWKGWASLRRIDVQGALLCAAGTICVMLGLTWGGNHTYAWFSPAVLGALALGALLFGLFVAVERAAREPVLPLELFRSRIFTVSALLALLQMMLVMGFALYLPLFFQGVLGVSPTSSGLVMTPFSVSMVIGAMLGSMAISKLKAYRLVAILGAAMMCVGALLIATMSPSTSLPVAILFLVLAGMGIGPFFTVPMLAVQNALPASELGVGTASVRYLGQAGATLGIAIVGTAVSSGVSGALMSRLPVTRAGKLALSGALSHGFVAILVFAVVALVATFFLRDAPAPVAQASAEPEAVTVEEDEARELIVA